MRKQKEGDSQRRHRDIDAVSPRVVDWVNLLPIRIELDPVLVEQIRARQALKKKSKSTGERG